jgi:hypothetical protein
VYTDALAEPLVRDERVSDPEGSPALRIEASTRNESFRNPRADAVLLSV